MTKPTWRRVQELQGSGKGSIGFLDKLAKQKHAPCLRFRGDDEIALALDPSDLGAVSDDRSTVPGWILVTRRELQSDRLEELLRVVRAVLPVGSVLTHVACLGASKSPVGQLSIPGTDIHLELQPVPDSKPRLGADTEARKLPEGSLSDRESWFRGRTGNRDND